MTGSPSNRPRSAHNRGVRRQCGAAFLEFALTVPVLLMFITGIIQFGYIFAAYITLRNGATVAARYYALDQHDSVKAHVVLEETVKTMMPTTDRLTAVYDDDVEIRDSGNNLVATAYGVYATYQLPLIFPYRIFFSSGTVTLSATSIMR